MFSEAPKVIIKQIVENPKENFVDVQFFQSEKISQQNPFHINNRLKGHPDFKSRNDHGLSVWQKWYDIENFKKLGFKIGDNVNDFVGKTIPEYICLYEFETTILSSLYGLNRGLVVCEPVYNPKYNTYLKSSEGNLIFRFTELIYSKNLTDLYNKAVLATLKVERMRSVQGSVMFFEEIYEGDKYLQGTKKKTNEYKRFLTDLYEKYNAPIEKEALTSQNSFADVVHTKKGKVKQD